MKIINLQRVLGSWSLVFAVASCHVQAEAVSLDDVIDAHKPASSRASDARNTNSELSLRITAGDYLHYSNAGCGVADSKHPIRFLSHGEQTQGEQNMPARKIGYRQLALRPIHFQDSSSVPVLITADANLRYRFANIASLAIPPDDYIHRLEIRATEIVSSHKTMTRKKFSS